MVELLSSCHFALLLLSELIIAQYVSRMFISLNVVLNCADAELKLIRDMLN